MRFLPWITLAALLAGAAPAQAGVYLCIESGVKVFRSQPCGKGVQTAQQPADAARREAAPAIVDERTAEIALSMVKRLRMGENLPYIGLTAAATRGAYRLMVLQSGESGAQELLQTELEKLMPAYRDRWDRYMARAYAQHFSAEALLSLRDERDQSKYLSVLVSRQDAVDKTLLPLGAELLEDYVSEALSNALDKAAPPR